MEGNSVRTRWRKNGREKRERAIMSVVFSMHVVQIETNRDEHKCCWGYWYSRCKFNWTGWKKTKDKYLNLEIAIIDLLTNRLYHRSLYITLPDICSRTWLDLCHRKKTLFFVHHPSRHTKSGHAPPLKLISFFLARYRSNSSYAYFS